MSNAFTEKVSGRFGSRTLAIALGIGAAILAGILLFVYVDRYRESVAGENAPTQVLQAGPVEVDGKVEAGGGVKVQGLKAAPDVFLRLRRPEPLPVGVVADQNHPYR